MVKSVVREYHWSPIFVGDLFVDEVDEQGLVYWYNDVKEIVREMQAKMPKK
jgi:hypothetical protein